MQVAQKNPAIPCGNALACFCRRTHSRKLGWRHDEQKLMSRFRQENEFLCLVPTPARRNRDSIFLVDGMPEFSGKETFGWKIVVHVSSGEFIHFAPLDSTFNHLPAARSIKKFQACLPILTSTVSSSDHEIFQSRADSGLYACRLWYRNRIEPVSRTNSERRCAGDCFNAPGRLTHSLQVRQRAAQGGGDNYRSRWQTPRDDSLRTG